MRDRGATRRLLVAKVEQIEVYLPVIQVPAGLAAQQELGPLEVIQQLFRGSRVPKTHDLVKIWSLTGRTDGWSLVDGALEPTTTGNAVQHIAPFSQTLRAGSEVAAQGNKYSFQRFHVPNIDILPI